ncbi:hypothetical protein RWE87_13420 [Sinorhizobium meliloti]|uniref:hypothetical protein n=1 Tax=Rhizobium meliloti TaxID=382 RepID=UPI00299DA1DB|nr:hypothetical protein [Sinorhizobium meliloti]MDX0267638.1 hypothetical protein [Sinorhizobium meliloti]
MYALWGRSTSILAGLIFIIAVASVPYIREILIALLILGLVGSVGAIVFFFLKVNKRYENARLQIDLDRN